MAEVTNQIQGIEVEPLGSHKYQITLKCLVNMKPLSNSGEEGKRAVINFKVEPKTETAVIETNNKLQFPLYIYRWVGFCSVRKDFYDKVIMIIKGYLENNGCSKIKFDLKYNDTKEVAFNKLSSTVESLEVSYMSVTKLSNPIETIHNNIMNDRNIIKKTVIQEFIFNKNNQFFEDQININLFIEKISEPFSETNYYFEIPPNSGTYRVHYIDEYYEEETEEITMHISTLYKKSSLELFMNSKLYRTLQEYLKPPRSCQIDFHKDMGELRYTGFIVEAVYLFFTYDIFISEIISK